MKINFGSGLKRLRASKGFTQQEMADKLCVTLQTYCAWENEGIKPSLSIVLQLEKIYMRSAFEIVIELCKES